MAIRVGINGFGRIGRIILRIGYNDPELEFVAVNDITFPDMLGYLFKYDSVHGKFKDDVKVEGDNLIVAGKNIKVLSIKDPAELPWRDMGVDIVVEATGLFLDRDSAMKHINAGAKKVLISAPAKKPDGTFVLGVNGDDYDPEKHNIISIGSCTTNCFAPVVKVLNDKFGIAHGLMTTIHAYTANQNILDAPHKKDFRRARAACLSILPTTTGAAKAISLVIPEVDGKLDGLAVRVPVPDGSLVDFTVELEKSATVEDINKAMKEAAEGPMKGILEYSPDPVVSVDIVGNPYSSVFDPFATKVIGDKMAKVFSWYDNEWGFSARMVDMIKKML
ncbi:type I glyceraldehyde-3-phosphate dehydrogenase [bacterium]|nr:type I glyceraldehyde-3-phosphate dehydrogenase [bacterium]